jgi:hypothetical protein
MEPVWWFANDKPMSLVAANLHDEYTVKQVGNAGNHCWRMSCSRPNVSMTEAIVHMRIVYPGAHRTMDLHLLPGYLGQIHPTVDEQ